MLPIKYKFGTRSDVMQEMARLSATLQRKAQKTIDPELRAFYNGKAHMCAELSSILSMSCIDDMEKILDNKTTG